MNASRLIQRNRRGTVLIVCMILLFALAGMTLVLCRSMQVETIASANYAASVQASTIERGAKRFLIAMLTDPGTGEQVPDPQLYDESAFAAVPVGDGYYWILRPNYGDDSLPAFGLTDESSKLNINIATYDQLMYLPNMTDEFAASIIDWRDADSTLSANGAENEYYLALNEAYFSKNSDFETVEELLLVRGATPELIYGQGQPDPLGVTTVLSSSSSSMFTGDLWLKRGLYDLLTAISAEPTTGPDGTERVNLSDRNAMTSLSSILATQLGDSRATEIMRAVGSTSPRDIFDLYQRSKMTPEELALIADYIGPPATGGGNAAAGAAGAAGAAAATGSTTSTATAKIRGRININSAPREVLLTLPNLEPADVDKLIAQRNNTGTNAVPYGIAWVADALGDKAIGLGNLVTGRPYQYSADILAVSGNGRAFKRVRVVIDVSGTTPVIIYRRDLTDRGWPMDPEILTAMRSGQGPGAWASGTSSVIGGPLR